MAEFALGLTKTAVEGTVSRVKSAIDEEEKLKVRVQNDLVFITGEFEMMQSFLNVANKERATNEVVRTWVRQIRELAFDVEDCIELVIGLDIKSGWSWLWRVLPGCVAPSRPLDDAVAKIEQLKARVEDVSHRNARYNLIGDSGTDSKTTTLETTVSKSPAPDLMNSTNQSSSAFDILREVWEAAGKMRHDMGDLKKLITREGSGLEVISLWGSQGSTADIGTTSIVRKAYNDPEICQEFKIRAWVKLMHPFNLDKFLESLLTQFYASSHQPKVLGAEFSGKMRAAVGRGDDLMKAQLMQQVSDEQRYLVIVEQLSTMAEWDTIRMYLPDSENGSRIVVTVQQLGLALSCTGEPYHVAELGQFSDRQSLCAFFVKQHIKEKTPMGDSDGFQQPVRHSIFSRFLPLVSPEDTNVDESDEEVPSSSQVVGCIDKKVKAQLAKFLSLKPYLVPGPDPDSRNEQRSRLLCSDFSARMVEACNWITKSAPIGHYQEWINLCHNLGKGVISVWGIAGVGKSALVRGIYYNNMIGINQNHPGLQCHACGILSQVTKHSWVDVPDPFSLPDLSRRLLLDFHSDDVDAKETEALVMMEGQDPILRCRKFMRQECCFVVIDGLRSTDDWDYIKEAFLFESIEGCIIVITNDGKVAAHCADKEDKVINVKGLEADVAINLFTKIVWGGKQLTFDKPDLSRRITDKCGGLPKVISAIGDYCRYSAYSPDKCLKNLNADFMGMLETDPKFHSLRGLFSWMRSYFDDCPDSLKPCIYYLSIFPFGHIIRRRRLLRRWIAEGYARDTPGSTAEENGEKFFSELVKLSIIQQEQSPSKVDVFRVNGFFREYIISRPMQDNLVFTLEQHCSMNSQRSGQHLTISRSWDRAKILLESMELSRLRSFTVFGGWESFFISDNVNMKLLRVLDLEDTSGVRDSDLQKIGEFLPRLKYLSLRGCNDITRLPSSLGSMRQLQTLDIKGTSVVTLPQAITKLEKLQYLRAGATRHKSTSSEHNNGTVAGVGTPPAADGDGASTSQQLAAATPPPTDSDGASTSQAAPAAAAEYDESRRSTPPWRSRPHGGFVFNWLSMFRPVSSAHDGVQFPCFGTRGIGKLRALHTLGVVNVEGASGNAVLRELKKLAQLRKLKLSGINRKNWKDFCEAISGHGYLESLSVRLNEEEEQLAGASIVFGCFSDILKPPKTLKTLKVYGMKSAHISPVWLKQLHNLTEIDLELTISTQQDIDALTELPRDSTLPRVCVKPTQDGELKFYWGDRGHDISIDIKALEIYCSSYKLNVLFDDREVEPDHELGGIRVWKVSSYQLRVTELVVHCSSTEASLELYGLGNVRNIKKVLLKGSYSDAQEQHLRQQLGRKLERISFCTQREIHAS